MNILNKIAIWLSGIALVWIALVTALALIDKPNKGTAEGVAFIIFPALLLLLLAIILFLIAFLSPHIAKKANDFKIWWRK